MIPLLRLMLLFKRWDGRGLLAVHHESTRDAPMLRRLNPEWDISDAPHIPPALKEFFKETRRNRSLPRMLPELTDDRSGKEIEHFMKVTYFPALVLQRLTVSPVSRPARASVATHNSSFSRARH